MSRVRLQGLAFVAGTSTRWPYDDRASERIPCAFHPWMVHDGRVMADIAARIAALPVRPN